MVHVLKRKRNTVLHFTGEYQIGKIYGSFMHCCITSFRWAVRFLRHFSMWLEEHTWLSPKAISVKQLAAKITTIGSIVDCFFYEALNIKICSKIKSAFYIRNSNVSFCLISHLFLLYKILISLKHCNCISLKSS